MFINALDAHFYQFHVGMLGASKYLAPNLEVTFENGKQTSRLTYPFQLKVQAK